MEKFVDWLNEEYETNAWYHGSTKLFNSFKLGKYRRSQQLGFGIHFAQDENFAKLYGNYIYICNLFPSKILHTDQIYEIGVGSPEEEFAKALHKGTGRRLWIEDNKFMIQLDITTPQRAERLLRQFGYDAVVYNAKYGTMALRGMNVSNESKSMVMLDSSEIKILNIKTLN